MKVTNKTLLVWILAVGVFTQIEPQLFWGGLLLATQLLVLFLAHD